MLVVSAGSPVHGAHLSEGLGNTRKHVVIVLYSRPTGLNTVSTHV